MSKTPTSPKQTPDEEVYDLEGGGTRRVAAIDEAELTIRMFEAATQTVRPDGIDTMTALKQLDPLTAEALHRAARAAVDYIVECIRNSARVN